MQTKVETARMRAEKEEPNCRGTKPSVLVSCSVSSLPKTRRESTRCCVTNPQQVPNLLPVRALPDADFAGFPTGVRGYASTQSGLLQHADIDKEPTEQDTREALT